MGRKEQQEFLGILDTKISALANNHEVHAFREEADALFLALPEADRQALGSELTRRLYAWRTESHASVQSNPYAGLVYKYFPPVGGA